GVARFVHSGVNCAIHANGEFYGLYTCRLKKTRENYAVDNNNPNHIFIDSQLIGAKLGENTYTSYDDAIVYYEMRSPKSSAITQTTKDNVMRFFDYARGVQNSTVDLAATYSEYFDLI